MRRHKKADPVIVELKRRPSRNEARAPRRGRFLSEAAPLFFSSSPKKRWWRWRGSSSAQALGRSPGDPQEFGLPNCLTGPPISTYFASPPTIPLSHLPDSQVPLIFIYFLLWLWEMFHVFVLLVLHIPADWRLCSAGSSLQVQNIFRFNHHIILALLHLLFGDLNVWIFPGQVQINCRNQEELHGHLCLRPFQKNANRSFFKSLMDNSLINHLGGSSDTVQG